MDGNEFHADTKAAQEAAFVAHVKAELGRLGMSALALCAALGVRGDRLVPGRLVQDEERAGLRP